jgi:hypothetical protein
MKAPSYIDPLEFLKEMNKYGCKVTNIKKASKYTYYLNCENAKPLTTPLDSSVKNLSNTQGEYWVSPNGYKKIAIKSSPLDFWHPYVVFYDENLNILNIIVSEDKKRQITAKIPRYCSYIKIRDAFTKENIKRGIFVKGIK